VDAGSALQFGSGGVGDAGPPLFPFGNGGAGDAGSAICDGEVHRPERSPIDLYLMLDQGASTGGGDSWSALQSAVTAFVQDPKADGYGVAVQYFPLNGSAPASCDAPYATPDVEVGLLPGSVGPLVASVQAHQAAGARPTAPALSGAIDHMKSWGPAHPGRTPLVFLVMRGLPDECDPQQIADLAAIAKTGFETEPRVRTFVVGVNLGADGPALDPIAAAGGAGRSYPIDGADVARALDEALLGVSALELACSFYLPALPDGTTVDPTLVQVVFTPNIRQIPEQLPRLMGGAAACASNDDRGWYFDSDVSPHQILLCSGTCADEATGMISIGYGCPGKTLP